MILAVIVASDLLYLDGDDLCGRPPAERKRLLDELGLIGRTWATNRWHCERNTQFAVCADARP
jgi:ATP-dependent DNA ligase